MTVSPLSTNALPRSSSASMVPLVSRSSSSPGRRPSSRSSRPAKEMTSLAPASARMAIRPSPPPPRVRAAKSDSHFRNSCSTATERLIEIDERRLDANVLVHRVDRLVDSDPRLLERREGKRDVAAVIRVDVDIARADRPRDPEGAPDVARPDARGQTVGRVVRQSDAPFDVLDGNDGEHGPEDLLASHLRPVRRVPEDRRL